MQRSDFRIRLLALAVIATGGLPASGLTAQAGQEEGAVICFSQGGCPVGNANAVCAAINGEGWWGYCGNTEPWNTGCSAPTPERLFCDSPV